MFQGMRYVYEVYKEMSFSKAARNLYISQPSLSAAVKKAEQEAGFPIFDRSTSPIRLTEPGREYIRAVERILDVENGFQSYLNDLNGLRTGSISIGGTNLFVSFLLPPLLSRFTASYPAVEIQLTEASTEELTERLFAGQPVWPWPAQRQRAAWALRPSHTAAAGCSDGSASQRDPCR